MTSPVLEKMIQRALGSTATYELKCDMCGVHLGWVYEGDENSNYHFCDSCREKALKEKNDVQEPE